MSLLSYGATLYNPFHQVWECQGKDKNGNPCGYIAQSQTTVEKHLKKFKTHSFIQRSVNGPYIKERKDQCYTKWMKFEHAQEDHRHDCQAKYQIPNSCWCRNCSKCEGIRRWRVMKKDLELLGKFQNPPKFVTLTFAKRFPTEPEAFAAEKKARELQLREFIRHVIRHNGKFAYIRVWEFKRKKDGLYGHIHMIADWLYFPQSRLSELWWMKTGDSYITDIRALKNKASKKSALEYIAKYIAKPLDVTDSEYATLIYRKQFHQRATLHLIREHNSGGMICQKCGQCLTYMESEDMLSFSAYLRAMDKGQTFIKIP